MSSELVLSRRRAHARPRATSSRLYRDATSLASSSMLTALLGVAFWAVAARTLPPSKLGVQTAVLSALIAPAIVVASGVGDAFTALLPTARISRAGVVRRGYRIVLWLSATAGIVSATVAVTVLHQVRGSIKVAALVAVGTVVWALFTVQDSALTSMGRAKWLPIENGAVSLLKVALLPALAAFALGMPIVVATLVPAAAAVAVLLPRVRAMASGADAAAQPIANGSTARSDNAAEQLNALVWRTTLSVALTLGALTFLPFVVTAISGGVQGAVFALCLSITQTLDFVGSALGVSLVVHASADGADGAAMARVVLRRAVVIVGGGAVALVLASPIILRVMNPAYVHLRGVEVIAILCGSAVLRTVFVTWSALQRSRRALRPVLVLNTAGALTLYGTLAMFCGWWGAVGAALALATAQAVLSVGAAIHIGVCAYRRRHIGTRRRTQDINVVPPPLLGDLVEATGGRSQ